MEHKGRLVQSLPAPFMRVYNRIKPLIVQVEVELIVTSGAQGLTYGDIFRPRETSCLFSVTKNTPNFHRKSNSYSKRIQLERCNTLFVIVFNHLQPENSFLTEGTHLIIMSMCPDLSNT